MEFLQKDYQEPVSKSNYMKLQEGENIIRILSPAIHGWEGWKTQPDGTNKPVRVPQDKIIEIGDVDDPDKIRFFWAFVVWNYAEKQIQILELRQRTIQRAITALVNSKAWGDPGEYDIMITMTKTGSEARDVEYSVMPNPKEKIDESITKLLKDNPIRLEALFEGNDPFQQEEEVKLTTDEQDKLDEIAEDVPF